MRLLVLALVLAPSIAAAQGAKQRKRVALGGEVALGIVRLDPEHFLRVDNTPWEKGTKSPRKILLHVIDGKSGAQQIVELPLGDFESKHKDRFYDEAPFKDRNGWSLADFDIEPVQFDGKQAHAILRQHRFGPKVSEGYLKQRYLLARWDLEQKTIDRVSVLADFGKVGNVESLGPSSDGKGLWLQIDAVGPSTRIVKVHRVALDTGALDEGKQIELPLRERRVNLSGAASRNHEKIVLVEYSEQADGVMSPPAKGAILDTRSGQVALFDVPWTPYGLDFDRAAKRLAVGSNQAGTLELLDADTGKQIVKIKGAKSVQALAFSRNDKWIYVLASTLQGKSLDAYAVPSLKKRSLPVGKIVPGSQCFDADGSVFALDRTWVATWATAVKGKSGICWRDTSAVDLIDLD